jgi:cell division protein FtsB
MRLNRKRPPVGDLIFFGLCLAAGSYFTFAAIQGDYGVFRRMQIGAEAETLGAERGRLHNDVAHMTNLTHRMSDEYLDLDLLDQQARDVLGLARSDEIVIH